MSSFLAILKRINLGFAIISACALLAIMAVTVVNVTGRKLLDFPLLAGLELVELCGAVFVSFALAYTQVKRSHITMTILIDRLGKRMRAFSDISALVVNLAIVTILAWAGTLLVQEMAFKKEHTDILVWPVAPFRAVWVAGLIFLFVALFIHLLEALGKAIKR
jgi:TRAP-type C4-dicarboxylate transport system permease small subunit